MPPNIPAAFRGKGASQPEGLGKYEEEKNGIKRGKGL